MIDIAYEIVQILVDNKIEAGVVTSANSVAIGIYVGERLMQVKLTPELVSKDPTWIADKIKKSIFRLN